MKKNFGNKTKIQTFFLRLSLSLFAMSLFSSFYSDEWLIMFTCTKRTFLSFCFPSENKFFSKIFFFFFCNLCKNDQFSRFFFISLNQWSHNGGLTYILLRCNKWKSACSDRRCYEAAAIDIGWYHNWACKVKCESI